MPSPRSICFLPKLTVDRSPVSARRARLVRCVTSRAEGKAVSRHPPPRASTARTAAVMRRPRIWIAVISSVSAMSGRDHVEVAHGARLVLVGGQRHRLLRRLHRLVLHAALLLQDAEGREVVLHPLERGQHGLPVGRDGRVVGRAGRVGLRAPQPAVEQGLREPGPTDQKRLGRGEPLGEAELSKPARRAQGDGRIERGHRDPDLGVGGRDPPLGGGDVGPPLEELGRHPDRNGGRRAASGAAAA